MLAPVAGAGKGSLFRLVLMILLRILVLLLIILMMAISVESVPSTGL